MSRTIKWTTSGMITYSLPMIFDNVTLKLIFEIFFVVTNYVPIMQKVKKKIETR